jgi:hypothetical protein
MKRKGKKRRKETIHEELHMNPLIAIYDVSKVLCERHLDRHTKNEIHTKLNHSLN